MSPTSSTHTMRSSSTSRQRPASSVHRHDPVRPADSGTRRQEPAYTVALVALAVLMGLTSWAVASISVWMVPIYVTTMVLIFVVPRAQGLHEPAPAFPADDGAAHQVPEANRLTHPSADAPAPSTGARDGSFQAPSPGEPLPGVEPPKRRRSRGGSRKGGRAGPEPAAAPTTAAWIRVGPGKFVRADSHGQELSSGPEPHAPFDALPALTEADGSLPGPADEPGPAAVPPSEVLAPLPEDLREPELADEPERPAATPETAEVREPETEPDSSMTAFDPQASGEWPEPAALVAPAMTPERGDSAAEGIVPEPVAEEYGIAPSTFGTDPLQASTQDPGERGWSGSPCPSRMAAEPEAGTGLVPGSARHADVPRLRPRSIVCTVPGPGVRPSAPSRPQNVRAGSARRDLARLGRAAACRRVQPRAWQNAGRSSRAHRGYQPRSPPDRC